LEAKTRIFLAFKVGKMTDRSFRYDGGRLGHEQPNAMKALLGAKSEHELQHGGIGRDALAMLHGIHQSRRRHYLEALVHADKNSGGIFTAWIAPNWAPSICRGIEPSWLAG
jgi:hypothetical protein